VTVNHHESYSSQREKWITYDLGMLRTVAGPVKRWVTTGDGRKKYEFGEDINLVGKRFRFLSEADSVCTFEIQGVSI
jgi:hypothetical protein